MLRCTANERVLSDGLGGNQNDPLLQRSPTRRPHGIDNVLSCFATRAKAFQEGIREGRSGILRVHGLSRGLTRVTANTIRAFAFLRRELEDIGVVVNTSKTVALPPKGHSPTAEEVSLLESVDVRGADKGGVTEVGAPIGTDECALERTRDIVKEGGTDHLAHCLVNMPDKQAAALIIIESLG